MAFVFRFQQVLQIRLHEENEVKGRLAKKDGQIAEVNAQIKKFKDEYDSALEEKIIDLTAGNMQKIRMYPAYLARLQNSWEYYEEELERLEKQRQKILEELLEKRRDRMTFDKMREKDEALYKKEMLKKEQKKLDEFGNQQKNRLGGNEDA